jgi:hypothetical protein
MFRVTESENQNQALREENTLAFTKIYKKLESSATSDGYAYVRMRMHVCIHLGWRTFAMSVGKIENVIWDGELLR